MCMERSPKGKRIGAVENWRTNQDDPDYSIVTTGWNMEKSPGDLRKLAVTQTPVKYQQLTMVWRTQEKQKKKKKKEQQTSTKGIQDKVWPGGKGDPLRIVREIQIWPYYQMVYTPTRICLSEWDTQNSLGFWDTNGSPKSIQKTRASID